MAKVLGVTQVLQKNYKVLEIGEQWANIIGVLPDPFSMLVVGRPKNGKTSFVMQLCRHLAERYKVFYSSLEEGDSKTIQDALILADMQAVTGKFLLGDGFYFDELVKQLEKRNSPKIVVIDSLDYMRLTLEQYKTLIRLFPRKSFVIVCWGESSASEFAKPEDYFAKKIKYKVGTVVLVQNFVAQSRGRYGSTEPYVIWEKGAKKKRELQLALELNT